MLSLTGIIAKFQAAWTFVSETAPDVFDRAAEVFQQLGEGSKDIAEWFRKKAQAKMAAGPDNDVDGALALLHNLREEVGKFGRRTPAAVVMARKGEDKKHLPAAMQVAVAQVIHTVLGRFEDKLQDLPSEPVEESQSQEAEKTDEQPVTEEQKPKDAPADDQAGTDTDIEPKTKPNKTPRKNKENQGE
jgi:hypothetical protein